MAENQKIEPYIFTTRSGYVSHSGGNPPEPPLTAGVVMFCHENVYGVANEYTNQRTIYILMTLASTQEEL